MFCPYKKNILYIKQIKNRQILEFLICNRSIIFYLLKVEMSTNV